MGGGGNNQAGNGDADDTNAPFATVGGGEGNTASGLRATVGGGQNNAAGARLSTVAGGQNNTANHSGAAVGGGFFNNAVGFGATVGGGERNVASRAWSTVGGGLRNVAGAKRATVGGGIDNIANATSSTVGGGSGNSASGLRATVGGGLGNTASGIDDTLGGGKGNVASGGWTTVAGGLLNQANGTRATIPGGDRNTADGHYSFAAGRRAKADHQGSFVWADSNDFDFNSAAANELAVRATGGVRFVSAVDGTGTPTAGVQLAPGGGSWSSLSDLNAKANFSLVDGLDVLERLSKVPIETWSYKAQDQSIRHIGPMAQDFYAAFAVGEGDTHITTIDADGVALAAIQGLHQLVQEKEAHITALEKRLDVLEQAGTTGSRGRHPLNAGMSLPWAVLVLGGFLAVAALLFPAMYMRRQR